MPGKRVQIDRETWVSLDLLGKDRMMTIQDLYGEAIRDLLKKHNRPQSLKDVRACLSEADAFLTREQDGII